MKKMTATLAAVGMLLTACVSSFPAMAEEYHYPKTVTIGALTLSSYGEGYSVESCDKSAVEVEIPAEVDGCPVTFIEAWAFEDCEALTKVVMPDTIEGVGFDAFENCDNLADITFSTGLDDIGSGAFEDTAWFESQPDGVVYIGTLAYAYKFTEEGEFTVDIKDGTTRILSNFGDIPLGQGFDDHFFTLNIPASVTHIDIMGGALNENCMGVNVAEDHEAYASIDGVLIDKQLCTLLYYPAQRKQTEYTIPEGILGVEYLAFNDQEYLTEIVCPESLETIGSSGFASIPNLRKIVFNKNLKTIDENAFYSCTKLEEAVLPEGLESIGQSAFAYCDALTEMHIPASLKEMGGGIFRDCPNLKTLTVDEDNTVFECKDGVLYDMENKVLKMRLLTTKGETVIPEGIVGIDNYAFASADITQITIPEGVEMLPEFAFTDCTSLKTIDLPLSLTTIEDWAFNDCEALTTVNYAGTQELWEAIEIGDFENGSLPDAEVNFGGKELPKRALGDVSGDDAVDATDAAMILVAAAAQGAGDASGFSSLEATAADVDGSGEFDASDAAYILQYAAHIGAGGTGTLEEYMTME